MKFRPLVWRSTHPYLLADRLEDVTDPELIRANQKCDRSVSLYGYLRGALLKPNQRLHVAGVGDFPIADLAFLPDPCPLPDGEKKLKTLAEKDKSIYAPMSGVGGIVYDKDAVYIDLGGSHSHKKAEPEEAVGLVEGILATETTLNEKLEKSELRLFSGSAPLSSMAHREELDAEGRRRRKAMFTDGKEDVDNSEDDEGEEEEEEEEEDEDDEEDDSSGEEDNEENDEDAEQKPSKRPIEDAVPTKVAVKKLKVSSVNDRLMKDIGEDIGEGSDSESEQEEQDASEEKENQTKDISLMKKTEEKVFHHRLTTKADRSAHSKVAEALSKISEKETVADDSEDSEDDEDEGSEADDGESSENEDASDGEDEEETNRDATEDAAEGDDETIALNWKDDLAMKARDSFYARQSGTASLRRLVYGQEEEAGEVEEPETVGGLFKLKNDHDAGRKQAVQGTDCSVWGVEHPQDWHLEQVMERIKDCFVTGSWAKGRDAEELMKLDDEEDEEVYGDFEDLETGEAVSGKKADEDDDEEEKPNVVNYGGDREKELARRKESMERTLKLKRQFDSDYDGGDGDGDKSSYYSDLKKEVDDQSNLNRGEFDGMDDSLRVQYEGFRPGMYVRLELAGVPCELVQHHQPAFPLLLGGLLKGEDQMGYVQIRIKKHRWYPKILKNRDPLIISLGESGIFSSEPIRIHCDLTGWRRFQSLPIYSICDHNMRHRMLKYTPEHLHCDAHFWGPITPQGTGGHSLLVCSSS
jgi:ribosome biogenesis protein BMS1